MKPSSNEDRTPVRAAADEPAPMRVAAGRAAARLAIASALCSAALAPLAHADGVSQPAAPAALARLEQAFWICDHAAMQRGLDSGDAMACSVTAEELRNRRFGGDLDALLAWWQRGRAAAHRQLDAGVSRVGIR